MNFKYSLVSDTITAEDNIARGQWLMTNPRLTMGELVKQYEQKWSRWVGVKYSVACNSGSSANELMSHTLLESGRLRNKRIIMPSAGWVTSVSSAIFYGFEPIMCEADQHNFGLDMHHLEELLAEHDPGTVMLVHALGVPADMNRIMKLKEKYNFYLLEDACAAMGSTYKGRRLGTFGDMSSISTYFGHQFSTVEGGMVSTDDKELYTIAFMLSSHGWIKGLDPATRAEFLDEYGIKDIGTDFVFIYPGHNFRLTDDHAFIGLRQLDRMDWLVERRYANHLLYQRSLGNFFSFQTFSADSLVCSIHFCALAASSGERDFIISKLQENGIETRPYTSGNQGLHPYWFTRYGKFKKPFATQLYNCGFFLPNYPGLAEKDIEYICDVAKTAAVNYRSN